MTEEQPWHNLSEAAALTGLDREAIRSRTRRGQWPSRKNNRGELMVQIPPDLPTGPDRSADQLMTALVNDLVAEIGDLRAMLERAKAGRETAEAIRVAERDTAEAVRRAEVRALRELADRLTAELAEARRPWWHRLIAG
jgi:hypothetical protein